MNKGKPSRKFSGEPEQRSDKGKPGFKKDRNNDKRDSRKQRKEEYTGKAKRYNSNSDLEKPQRRFDKKPGEKPERRFDKKFPGKPDRDFSKRREGSYSEKPEKRFDKKNSDKTERSFSKRGDAGYSREKDTSIKGKERFEKKDGEKSFRGYEKKYKDRKFYKKDFSKKKETKPTFAEQGLTRLNKYIANAGICSRREADDLIASGCVTVNGKTITELGYKVKEGDVVNYSGASIKAEKHIYLLLNKPKDYITTADDDRGRRTVMELLEGACKERIYPVGRLDRNTTGLLLFTNDGELTKKLTHPKHNVQKLYHVELDKNLKQTDLLKIREGLELEDGFIKPDEVSYAGETKREVGIQIHSGANRIVRRIFEKLEYEVVKLDRVMFAGLTKKNLPKGRWRFLTDQEVSFLKMV